MEPDRLAMTKRPSDQPPPLAERTSREQQMILRALRALQRTAATPATKRLAWRQRTRRELAAVVGLLQEHCEAAEGADGLVAQVEVQLGRSREVSRARRDHRRLQRDAAILLAALDEYAEGDLSARELRKRVSHLIEAMREHQSREADLLLLALDLDVGVPD
jgi:hypothetical protein